ncbi:MAG: spermidine synthase [Pseudomonadota bacterium]
MRTLSVLFFFSGFPALIYQLVWQRALFRIFGVNIESVTIVVTAFMLGLGMGALAGGWLSRDRRLPLLLLLALIEALTAVFGVVSLPIFESVGGLVLGVPLALSALVTLGLVVVPTLLMGATLPLLVGHLAQRSGNVGNAVGQLYYVNTLGAGAACLVAAIGLFPTLGMKGSVHLAVALNAAVALGAVTAHLMASRRADSGRDAGHSPPSVASPAPAALPFGAVLAMSCAAGLVSLSYEIFFFRAMSYATASSPFAFATTLGAFLIGLASGARVGAEACAAQDGDALVGRMLRSLLLGSAFGFLYLPLLSHLAWLDRGILGVGLLGVYLVARQWGLVMPCLAHLGVAADGQAGMRTGLLYLANIVGAASGSVLTGFVLMDHLTLVQVGQWLLAAGLGCVLVLGFIAAGPRAARLGRVGAITLAGGLAIAALPTASGRLLEALQFKGGPQADTAFSKVIENRSGIVAVDAKGTVYGSGAYDGHFNVELVNDVNGIVRPYALSLFHPAPRDVLMIGLASGSWAQVVANHPDVASLTIVEINPGYVALVAGRPEVASVLANPKVRLVKDDGRRWLRLNPNRRFDVIVSNTTFHFRANATNLLSTDFMAILKPHLNPGGIVFYNTTDSSRVQRTGCSSFAHGARFTNHVVLSADAIDWDFARWRRSLLAYRIDGRAVLDLSNPVHAQGLGRLMALEPLTQPGVRHDPRDWIEPCEQVLARTVGQALLTDDNMGTEWNMIWGRP